MTDREPPFPEVLDDVTQMWPLVFADPPRRGDLLPCRGIEAMFVVSIGVPFPQGDMRIVIAKDAAIRPPFQSSMITVLNRSHADSSASVLYVEKLLYVNK